MFFYIYNYELTCYFLSKSRLPQYSMKLSSPSTPTLFASCKEEMYFGGGWGVGVVKVDIDPGDMLKTQTYQRKKERKGKMQKRSRKPHNAKVLLM